MKTCFQSKIKIFIFQESIYDKNKKKPLLKLRTTEIGHVFISDYSQQAFTCLKLTTEALEQGVKYVES